ncbi:signal peptidase I [Paenibacillus sp. PR3]|uniref:Signal peptidase I n=1 Tax=Paenibacillus terricola TaxID=2763503 RepID=A0ABR8MYT8_9BACL|nr:signal peptidase I [Paenibacillus terricola]MBD3921101.1 signal peptidase I [Paenibacillus terricola]
MADLESETTAELDDVQRFSIQWMGWIKTISIALTIVLLLHAFVFHLSKVEGHSMEPTLHDHDWLYVNKFVYLFGNPKIGDVVILEDPSDNPDKKLLVKRVIGVPGDRIEIRNRVLYRNGERVDETTYTDTEIDDLDFGPYEVPDEFYFVMGDNRHARASRDSRSFGPVIRDRISGRVDWIVWPTGDLGSL